jgi:hypothetical protein
VVGAFQEPSCGRSKKPIHSIPYSVAQPLERGFINYYSIIQGARNMSNLTYSKNGDYMIPDLTLPEDSRSQPLGKYGRMRKNYLKEHRTAFYNHLLLSGTLTEHLTEIELAATRRMEQTMPELMRTAGVTEGLKASDPMKWTGLMNSLKAQTEEIILTELIYN